MYCRKCGMIMAEDDLFCTRCGTPVRRPAPAEEQPQSRPSAAAYNPEFTWNVQGFPAEPRKTADIDFQWGAAPGYRAPRPYADPLAAENPWQRTGLYQTAPETQVFQRPHMQTAEIPVQKPAAPAYEAPEAPAYEAPAVPAYEAPAAPDLSLEEELFREMEESTRQAKERQEEKFYTFSKKNEEFQRLLDREYEKIRRNGTPAERPASFLGLDDTPVPASLQEEFEAAAAPAVVAPEPAPKPQKEEPARSIWEEIRADLEREAAEAEASKAAAAVSNAAEASAAPAEPAVPAAETKAEPADVPKAAETTALAQTLPPLWFELDDDDDEEEGRKGTFWKVLLGILIVLLVVVGGAFAVKHFLPDSGLAEIVTSAEDVILELWNGLFGE